MRPQARLGDLLGGATVRDPLATCPLEERACRAAELAAGDAEDRIETWLKSLFQEATEQKRGGGIGDEVREDRDAAVFQLRLRLRRHRVVGGLAQQAAIDARLGV